MKVKLIATLASLLLIFGAVTAANANNIIKVGSDATVAENQTINNVIVIGGQITVSGLVERHLVTIGGSVVLTGKSVVRGNVLCVGGVIVRGSGAQVFGNLKEINSSNITKAFGSFFRGEPDGWPAVFDIFFLFFQVIIFILAILLAFVLPGTLTALKKSIQKNKIKSFFLGFFITLMITPFFILLVISIIGIYLIPLFFVALIAAFMLGYIAAATILGEFTLSKTFSAHNKSLLQEAVLGLIILLVLGWIPFVGWLIKIFALTMGFGSVLLVMFSRGHR